MLTLASLSYIRTVPTHDMYTDVTANQYRIPILAQSSNDPTTLLYNDYLVCIAISIAIFLIFIFISYLLGLQRFYFPSTDKTLFGICWLHGPVERWSPFMYVNSIRGSEYLMSYLWMLKDFCWTQDYWVLAQFFGVISVIWSCALVCRSIYLGHFREVIVSSAATLWLLASFCWMRGELIDKYYPDSPEYPVYYHYSLISSYILFVAVFLMVVYYTIILPLSLLKPPHTVSEVFNEHGFTSPCPSVFPLWRDYENFHIVCWLGKDLALYFYLVYFIDDYFMWTVCVIPTALIGIHFIILTFFVKTSFVDHLHYYSQFMWLLANFVWAFGEIFKPFGVHDDAIPFTTFNADSYSTMRWWCSWLLVAALLPLMFMYLYWIPATYSGRIDRIHLDSIDFSISDKLITAETTGSMASHNTNPSSTNTYFISVDSACKDQYGSFDVINKN